MSEVINLRLARKAAARRTKEADAAANRLAYGRTRAEKAVSKAEADRATRLLDGAKRDGRD